MDTIPCEFCERSVPMEEYGAHLSLHNIEGIQADDDEIIDLTDEKIPEEPVARPTEAPSRRIRVHGNRVSGLISELQRQLQAESDIEFRLCDECDLFRQTDNWTCGPRNFQILLDSLHRRGLINQSELSVSEIQNTVDEARRQGFDPRVIRFAKTKRWMGAVDFWALLSHLNVDVSLVDSVTRGNEKHVMLFRQAWNALGTGLPVYLQRGGHSLTVIGAVRRNGEMGELSLLLWDPLNRLNVRSLRWEQLATPLNAFKRREYQLLMTTGERLTMLQRSHKKGAPTSIRLRNSG
ncbi:MAG: hypothetical protein MHM6MM_001142 [Cercozoa sp. M6MM]